MSRVLLATFLFLIPDLFLLGQETASMSAPLLRTTPQEISLTARFSNFVQGSYYRLGIGTTAEQINDLEMEILKGNTVLAKELISFEQGFTQSWFEVDQISIQGFHFLRAEVPEAGEELTLKVSFPRAEGESHERLFIIIARRYSLDRWYIEDGSELEKSSW